MTTHFEKQGFTHTKLGVVHSCGNIAGRQTEMRLGESNCREYVVCVHCHVKARVGSQCDVLRR